MNGPVADRSLDQGGVEFSRKLLAQELEDGGSSPVLPLSNNKVCGNLGLSYCLSLPLFPHYWFFNFIIPFTVLDRSPFIQPLDVSEASLHEQSERELQSRRGAGPSPG